MTPCNCDRLIHVVSGTVLLVITFFLWDRWRTPQMPPDIQGAQQSYAAAVETVTVTITKTDRATQRVAAAAGELRTALDSTTEQLSTARETLEDSLATIDTLRSTLAQTVTLAETLTTRVETYMGTVDSLQTSFQAERQSFQAALVAADTLVATQQRALEQQRCRILFFNCPSRKTSAVLGAGAVVVVGTAIKLFVPQL